MNTIAPAVMQNLVAVVENGHLMTTSLKVAEAFGKLHKNVLRKLETLGCSPKFNELNFEPVEYLDEKGELRKAWNMTKDGFMFLVMGFSGAKAAAVKETYIGEFNRMADELHRRELAMYDYSDIPFPPTDGELLKCDTQQLAKVLCQKALTTRFMLSIDPEHGLYGRNDSLTLYPISSSTHLIDPANLDQLQHMFDFLTNEELNNIMKLGLDAVARRSAALAKRASF